jgi:signal transduction histidine kinase
MNGEAAYTATVLQHPLVAVMLVLQIVALTVFVHQGLTQWALYRATRAQELATYALFSLWSALFTLSFMTFALPFPRVVYTLSLHGITIFGAFAMRSYLLSIDAFLDARSATLRRLAALQPLVAVWPLASAVYVVLGGDAFFLFERPEPPTGIVLELVHAVEPRNLVHPAHAVGSLGLLGADLFMLVRVASLARPRDYYILVGVWITCAAVAFEIIGMASGYRYAMPAVFFSNLFEVMRITYVSTLRTGRDRALLAHELSRQRRVIDEQLEALTASAHLSQLGGMTRELGHELRNPLASALLYVEGAQRRIAAREDDAGSRELLERAHMALGHASTLVSALHYMGRPPVFDASKTCVLAQAVDDALALAAPRLRGRDIRVEVSVPSELRVRGQRSELIQILLNLVTNACDACEPLADRFLRIEAEPAAERVRLRVTDAGPRPASMSHLFGHEYTTKAEARGSGLGLAITREIVRRLQGRIELDTASARTSFVIELALGHEHDGAMAVPQALEP